MDPYPTHACPCGLLVLRVLRVVPIGIAYRRRAGWMEANAPEGGKRQRKTALSPDNLFMGGTFNHILTTFYTPVER